jgi:uncharacterized caspase-like protein
MDSASRDFAIVIGISRYEHLPVLEGPARDATAFASWLSDPEGGRLDASDIQLLTSEQSNDARFPTLRDVNNAFRPLFEAEPADENRRRRLYVYATGHGFAVQGRAALVLADARPNELQGSLDLQAYADAATRSGRFEEVVLIADLDRSVEQSVSLATPPWPAQSAGPSASSFYIFASTLGRHAYARLEADDEGGVSGYFTSAVLEGLYGAAAGPDGSVDHETLSAYVRARMRELTEKQGLDVAPEVQFAGAGRIVFVEAQAIPLEQQKEEAQAATTKSASSVSATPAAEAVESAPVSAASGGAGTPPTGGTAQAASGQTPLLDGPSAHIASDVWTVQDALGYGAYAYAIYRFMTHPHTRPPLTISIQAPWGGGKTSLMRMIQRHLDPNGSDAVLHGTDKPRGELKVGEALDEAKRWIEPDTIASSGAPEKPTVDAVAEGAATPTLASAPESLPLGPPDRERHLLTVWFNAWKYESTREVWAGLVDAIMHQVAARLPVRERELFWLRLNLKRIDVDRIRQRVYDRVWRYWWRIMRWVIAGVALACAVFVLVALTSAPFLGWTLASVTAATGVATGVWRFVKTKLSVENEPAAATLGDFLDVPDYAKELGFIHQIEADLRRVLDSVPPQLDPATNTLVRQPIVVFVDDLDRCSPAKVAQVIEAVNLFLGGEFPNCIFVIGMDAEMVAAALQAAHKDLVSALPKDAGIPVGWRFMDKFVQLPFIIPPMPNDGVQRYTDSLFDTGSPVPAIAPEVRAELQKAEAQVQTLEEAASEADRIRRERGLDEERAAYLRAQLRDRAVQRTLRHGLDKFSDQSPDIRRIVAAGMPYFGGNPRELKRFVNAFRFNYFLWWAQSSQGLPTPKVEQLVRWTVLTMRWPEVVRWLRRSSGSDWSSDAASASKNGVVPSRLKLMEDVSGKSGDVVAWQKEAAATLRITQSDAPWLRDDDLLEFLHHEGTLPEADRLSGGAGLGLW